MCGIFGTLNYDLPIDKKEIFKGLWHRGPDAQQAQSMGNLILYHTRLAIQELSSAGGQPMEYNDLVIVFNGEIYNHLELRTKYNLKSNCTSDTKTILMLYEKLGMKMLEEFDGMFAFALYDLKTKMLYLARDRAGKKPLFVYHKSNTWIFSSTLNLLYQIARPQINLEALTDYLYLGYHYRKATPYHQVSELENGHYLKIDLQQHTQEDITWFEMSKHYQQTSSFNQETASRRLDELLKLAVNRRIDSSGLDVGSFLSGGIDSGLVTAIAAQHTSKLNTFTVKVPGSYDESHLAKQVAQRYSTNHTVVDIDFSTLNTDIESILSGHGEPNCDNSAIPSYYVAKAAKQHTTVVLNGDGADELFGGYRRYVPFKHFDFFKPQQFSKISAKFLTNILPLAHEKQGYYTYLYRLLKFAGQTDLVKTYCSASSDLFVGFEDQFINPPFMKNLSSDLLAIDQLPLSALNKILLMDFQSLLCSRLLPKMDTATMAHSLEGRSPFLAKELLEFAPALPEHFKIRNVTTKFILRDLATKYLPKTLIQQPKRGFEIPLREWVDKELKVQIENYLLVKDALYPQLIKKSFITDLLAKRIKISDERRAKILFCVFGLEVWYQKTLTNQINN